MKEPVLVIMAAGMGSRYGGLKQIDPVDENGNIIVHYSLYDAYRAGFRTAVFIIKPELEETFKEVIGEDVTKQMNILYVHQISTDLPEGYTVPEGRTKPWGTAHAALAARNVVDGPFAIINADDYYGVDAYRTIYEELGKLAPSGESTMVGYLLKNTASLHGTVSRGVCKVKDGKLDSIQETLKIQLYPDGHLTDLDTNTDLDPETVVSMNFWGFMPSIFPALRAYFEAFLRGLPDGAVKAECLLPVMVGEELKAGRMTVSVLNSKDKWFGMTYHEDRALVAEDLQKLHEAGVYPPSLRN